MAFLSPKSVVCAALASFMCVGVAHAAPIPRTDSAGKIVAPGRTQISLINDTTGQHFGTANEHESRPALSIVKLYIADYVYRHGTNEDRHRAFDMIRTSNDQIATQLYEKYPGSISDTARKYGLEDTRANEKWGYSTTSTYDSVKYLSAKRKENPHHPILEAMRQATPIAADGFAQNYGTSLIPGVEGTKFGWSDDRQSLMQTVSIGPDFSIAAQTNGPASQLTGDVVAAFLTPGEHDIVPVLPDQAQITPLLPGIEKIPSGASALTPYQLKRTVNDVLTKNGLGSATVLVDAIPDSIPASM